MLSFATEFPVKSTNSAHFVNAVRRWILESPHSSFKESELADIPSEGRWRKVSGDTRLEALLSQSDSGETVSFKYVAIDGHLEWVTEATYSRTDADNWVGVRTSRESDRPQVSLPQGKKPLLVRTILEDLGGGLDDELYVSDSPHYISDKDIRMVARLLNADAENYLPVVYVSAPFRGDYEVDFEKLARSLGGLAHVMVEPDRKFSSTIQGEVNSRNAYGGNIGLYWPNGEKYRYFIQDRAPTEKDLRLQIIADIGSAHLNRRPLARCTWSRAEAEVARAAFEALKVSGSDDVAEYVAAFDSEISAKNRQLAEAEAEIRRLEYRAKALEGKTHSKSLALSSSTEQELCEGEFDEVLKDALVSAANNSQDNSRRQHILIAVSEEIPDKDILKKSREELKLALAGYSSMTPDVKSKLQKLGFDISEDGKHYKIIYQQDERYVFPLPKSGSDWRGGMNAVSDIAKRVF